MSKILRSNVYVAANAYGGVYEIILEDSHLMKVNLEQTTAHWEGDRIVKHVRRVEHYTDIGTLKRGMILPGNILIALQTDPIIPYDEEQHLWYLEDGSIAHTPDKKAVYGYFYYAPLSKFTPDKPLDDDDIIEHFTQPTSI